MDEAEILGDRIAIMDKGRLQICGTPSFLKTKFGLGYTLIIEPLVADSMREDAAEFCPTQTRQTVQALVPEAEPLDESRADMVTYILPWSASNKLRDLFFVLEAKSDEYGIGTTGISMPTL